MLLGMLLIPMLDGCAKILTQTLPPTQITAARYLTSALILLPILFMRKGMGGLRVQNKLAHLFRALFLLGATFCFFSAIRAIPIPNAIALVFVYPLLVTLAAPFLLGEQLTKPRVFSTVLGFVGALVVLRPGMEGFEMDALYALAAGTLFSGFVLITRTLAKSDPPFTTLTLTSVIGTVVMIPFALSGWTWPTLPELGWMLGMGFFASAGHYCFIKALDHAPASQLAPFGYFEIIGATLVSYFGFNEFPDALTWVGIGIVVSSGVLLTLSEARPTISPESPGGD